MSSTKLKLVTCNGCGWVHFAVTRAYAENEVKTFNAFYDTLSRQEQLDFYGGRKSRINKYEGCFVCSKNSFRPAEEDDCPTGVTINPVIYEE